MPTELEHNEDFEEDAAVYAEERVQKAANPGKNSKTTQRRVKTNSTKGVLVGAEEVAIGHVSWSARKCSSNSSGFIQ